MSDIPQEWIEAGARALGTDAGCTADFDTLQRLYGWEAEAVLTAVLPLICEHLAKVVLDDLRDQQSFPGDLTRVHNAATRHHAELIREEASVL